MIGVNGTINTTANVIIIPPFCTDPTEKQGCNSPLNLSHMIGINGTINSTANVIIIIPPFCTDPT